jgi:hypothetical protein
VNTRTWTRPKTTTAPTPGSDSATFYPVPGTGLLSEISSADGWTEYHGEERFIGYLVQLEL